MRSNFYTANIHQEIIHLLNNSKESIKICVAWINGGLYGPILQQAANRGVKIDVIFNDDHINKAHGLQASPSYNLYPIKTQGYSSIMHHKFCIIDDEIVINGSYNWSYSAQTNVENITVTKNDYDFSVQLLHEFYDLISYHHEAKTVDLDYCHCKSSLYNLVILGEESGDYDSAAIEFWSICKVNRHTQLLHESFDQHLRTRLGLKDMPSDDEFGDPDSKYAVLEKFHYIRGIISTIQGYFNSFSRHQVHAVGVVHLVNHNEHYEYNEPPEYGIHIIWKNSYLRNIIPDNLYDDADGVHEIISKHMPEADY